MAGSGKTRERSQPGGYVSKITALAVVFLALTTIAAEDMPRNVDTHHLFSPPASRAAWETRAAQLRQQILFSAGLYPMPEKTPLNPRVTGRIEADDYIIENVAIETVPGFYLCGNLYIPKGKTGPFPGIVNPHGHWNLGRLEMDPDVPTAAPAPAKPAPGKANLTAIGVNLARQGFVVFAYDMAGYVDTDQVEHRKFAANLKAWLWNVSINGLQLWNSIRAVDYLLTRPEVDGSRIGVTGASGGGTQTFLLAAVDERVKAAVPVNMVSAYMQGGCLCENGPGLRVGTDNVEIAATFAPKPLLLIAATGDWTKHVPTEEWPVIASIYDFYDAREKTAAKQFNYEHNYNIESREAMYSWFGRWFLNDPDAEHFREKTFKADAAAMHVWTAANPKPANELKEPELIQQFIANSEKQLEAEWPKNPRDLVQFQKLMAPALAVSLGLNLSDSRALPVIKLDQEKAENILIVAGGTNSGDAMDSVCGAFIKRGYSLDRVVFPNVKVDLWTAFYTCYNRTPLGDHVQLLLDHVASVKKRPGVKKVVLVGIGPAGIPALFARAFTGDLSRTLIDVNEFKNNDDQAFIDAAYAPGLRRAGDVRTALLLAAPGTVHLYNSGGAFKIDDAAFKAAGVEISIEQTAWVADKLAD